MPIMQDMLFLSQRLPYPPNKGDKIRSFNILKHFAKSYRIHLGCFIDDPADWEHVPALQQYCADSCILPLNKTMAKIRSLQAFLTGDPLNLPYFHSAALGRWTDKVLADVRPRAAFAFSSQMAQFLLNAQPRPERIVIDYCDVDSDKWRQYAASCNWPMNWVYNREGRTLLEYDRTVARSIDAGTFVADQEVSLFNSLSPDTTAKIHAVGNGIDTEYFAPDGDYPDPYDAGGPVLIFTGAMDYWPNVDAVTWFSSEIFPAIQSAINGARFYIVGSNPSGDVEKLAQREGVFVTGRVPDMRPYLRHAQAAVTPMRIARGVQNKVLEAMAMSKPTVTTPTALAGIDAKPDRDIIVADGADDFIRKTIFALQDPAATALGISGRAFVVRECSWETRLAGYDALIRQGERAV